MDSEEIRKRFLDFFAKRGHVIVPSSSLIPDDPSVLLTTAGMQQFKPYFLGKADPMKDFGSRNTASIQKSFRTSDIDEVGDESHLTFFEMLGNFSFGGYFKEKAIEYAKEFLEALGLKIGYVTVFEGNGDVPADAESEAIWRKLGIKDIRKAGRADNFWGPTGNEGPCGPTTEIYVGNTEIWNVVFNEYYCNPTSKLSPLTSKGVDTGMGLERLAMVSQGKTNIFETDLFLPIINAIPGGSERARRIITDHIKGSVLLISEGILPSNIERGYILRRLLRRGIRYCKHLNLPPNFLAPLAEKVVETYKDIYPELLSRESDILTAIQIEEEKFAQSLVEGMRILRKLLTAKKPIEADMFYKIMDLANKKEIFRGIYTSRDINNYKKEFDRLGIQISQENFEKATISGREAFDLYQTHGFPLEMIVELAQEGHLFVDIGSFREEVERHQEISRAGLERKFGGHGILLDTGELKAGDEAELKKVTRLHTATHLLNSALHKVLGDTVEQRGSDITGERTRFDFSFPRKLTPEEIKKIEDLVHYAVKKNFPVTYQEMDTGEAKRSGALYFYKGNYPPRVRVYAIGDENEIFSRELCGGPHVSRTGEIGEFKILKEESSSAGVRRIRATVTP